MRAVLAVLILLLAACTVPPRPAVSWRPCGDGLECATVTVPLDWSVPAGATIDLAVARFPAAGDRLGALFVNPGGPGRSGVEALRTRGRELAALGGDRFDVVSWDPRGSTITCTDAESPPLLDDVAQRCGVFHGELLAHVSSTASARDLDHLRALMGDSQLTFYGESYGGFLGQVYANVFPARVRAMVLDGPPDPVAVAAGTEERLAASMTDARAVFGEFVRLCRAAGCPLTEQTLVDVLMATPIGALTYRDTLVATYSALQTPRRWPDLARGLAAAADGDGRLLLRQARRWWPQRTAEVAPAAAISCLDSPAQVSASTATARLEQFRALDPVSGPLLTWWQWAPCASWPVRGAHVYAGPWSAMTPNPVLVVGTTLDPVTPFRDAAAVARLLGNATLLTHVGYGHPAVSDPSVCVTATVRSYLVDLQVPATVCHADRSPFRG